MLRISNKTAYDESFCLFGVFLTDIIQSEQEQVLCCTAGTTHLLKMKHSGPIPEQKLFQKKHS